MGDSSEYVMNDWQLVYQSNFDGDEIPEEWFVDHGNWEIADGCLMSMESEEAVIVLNREFGGTDIRLEYDCICRDEKPSDIGALIGGYALYEAYLFSFGGNYNSKHVIYKNLTTLPEEILVTTEPEEPQQKIIPGKRHQVVCSRICNELSLEVDGRTVVKAEDAGELIGENIVGILVWSKCAFENVKVFVRGADGNKARSEQLQPVCEGQNSLKRVTTDLPHENLLSNGDFEEGAESDGIPIGWTHSLKGKMPDGLSIQLDAAHALTGRHCLKIATAKGVRCGFRLACEAEVKPETVYTFSVQFYNRSMTPERPTRTTSLFALAHQPFDLISLGSCEDYRGWLRFSLRPTGDQPRYFKRQVIFKTGRMDSQIRLAIDHNATEGEFFIDDARLVESGRFMCQKWQRPVPFDRLIQPKYTFLRPSFDEIRNRFEACHARSETYYAGKGGWAIGHQATTNSGEMTASGDSSGQPDVLSLSSRVVGYLTAYNSTSEHVYQQRACEAADEMLRQQSPDGHWTGSGYGDGPIASAIAQAWEETREERFKASVENYADVVSQVLKTDWNHNICIFGIRAAARTAIVLNRPDVLKPALDERCSQLFLTLRAQQLWGGWAYFKKHNNRLWYHSMILQGLAEVYQALIRIPEFVQDSSWDDLRQKALESITGAVNYYDSLQAENGGYIREHGVPTIRMHGNVIPAMIRAGEVTGLDIGPFLYSMLHYYGPGSDYHPRWPNDFALCQSYGMTMKWLKEHPPSEGESLAEDGSRKSSGRTMSKPSPANYEAAVNRYVATIAELRANPSSADLSISKKTLEVGTPQGLIEKEFKIHTNSVGMQFTRIPAGGFTMGWEGGSEEWRDAVGRVHTRIPRHMIPEHPVAIENDFFIGTHVVTKAQYEKVIEEPDWPLMALWWGNDNHPAIGINWFDCLEFCKRLSEKEGRIYRLPTETEWWYAGRARATTKYYWGDDDDRKAWPKFAVFPVYRGSAGSGPEDLCEVGTLVPNAFGLYDMSGNVWEWCQSRYQPYPCRAVDGREDLILPDNRVLNGGSFAVWDVEYSGWGPVNTDVPPNMKCGLFGFRVVVEVAPES